MRAFPPALSLVRGKRLVIAVGIFFTVVYLLSPSPQRRTDGVSSLEQLMNSNPPASHFKSRPSSFDWGTAPVAHPAPRPLTPLPTSKAGRTAFPRIQHTFSSEESPADRVLREERRHEVWKAADKAWASYRRLAWKQDALLPISGGAKDQFSGWAATLVDSLDTLWIMGMREAFDEAVDAVAEIDFGSPKGNRVNIFETNIRYLGGLLAAYDLSKRPVLLHKAVELGDLIYAGFDTPTRMPVDFIDVGAAKAGDGLEIERSVVSASPGTLSLELTRLSQVTADPKYYDAISRVTDIFYAQQLNTSLPGLFPMYVSMAGKPDVKTGATFTLGGGVDSLYEYFPKMLLLLGGHSQYEALTRRFVAAAKKHLFFRPMTVDNADILLSGAASVVVDVSQAGNAAAVAPTIFSPDMEHLTCFIGGTIALTGRLLASPEDVRVGARLARGCVYAYRAFATGVGPERFRMVPCYDDGKKTSGGGTTTTTTTKDDAGLDRQMEETCEWDEARWERGRNEQGRRHYKPGQERLPRGFTAATDLRYLLRPEAIESAFYMWRITGAPEWMEAAWDMFAAVVKTTSTPLAAAAVRDVSVPAQAVELEDYMESFWLAETLKYFYLMFSEPDLLSLDEWVFNTEAHPFLSH